MSEALVIFCTCPDGDTASRLGRGLVDQRLAACVNVLPGIRSIYRWQGKVNEDAEVLMVVKTTADRYRAIEDWLQDNHPYDVPEVVALPVTAISRSYLDWLQESVGE